MDENKKYSLLEKELMEYVRIAWIKSILLKYQEECENKVQEEREDEDLGAEDRWYDHVDIDLKCDTQLDREEMITVLNNDFGVEKEKIEEAFLDAFKEEIKNEEQNRQKVFLKVSKLYIESILNNNQGIYQSKIDALWDTL